MSDKRESPPVAASDDFLIEEKAKEYSQYEWDQYQEHLRIGGNTLHIRSFVQLGYKAGWSECRRHLGANITTESPPVAAPTKDQLREIAKAKILNVNDDSTVQISGQAWKARQINRFVQGAEYILGLDRTKVFHLTTEGVSEDSPELLRKLADSQIAYATRLEHEVRRLEDALAHQGVDAGARIAELEAENARLRAALKLIADDLQTIGVTKTEMRHLETALLALKGKGEG